jgi:hypothetical protein
MMNTSAVSLTKIAFGKTKEVNRVEQVCFSQAIVATNADNIFPEVKMLVGVIFELVEAYTV